MKFRDPKTGEVFEDIKDAYSKFCCGHDCDTGCPLYTFKVCNNWSFNHPAEAARLMGYEVVEEEEEPMEQTKKPHICEVLGGKENPLEVGERFTYPGMVGEFYITENGTLVGVDNDGEERPFMCASTLINCHDRILRKPRFTEEEVAFMRTIYAVAPSACFVRDNECRLYLTDVEEFEINSLMPIRLLPSLSQGQSVRLEEIIGGVVNAE